MIDIKIRNKVHFSNFINVAVDSVNVETQHTPWLIAHPYNEHGDLVSTVVDS